MFVQGYKRKFRSLLFGGWLFRSSSSDTTISTTRYIGGSAFLLGVAGRAEMMGISGNAELYGIAGKAEM